MSENVTPSEFQKIQDEYDGLYREAPIRDEDEAYRWMAQKLLSLKQGIRSVLDIACGGGYFLREIKKASAPHPLQLAGVDLSEVALELAKCEIPEASLSKAVAEKLPFPDRSFDAVSCLGSLEHFLDIPAALREMRRVTRPDGFLFILVPNIFWYKDILSVLFTGDREDRNQTHEMFASVGEWTRLIESQGLSVIATAKYNGISKTAWKQTLKEIIIPLRFSYHFLFTLKPA